MSETENKSNVVDIVVPAEAKKNELQPEGHAIHVDRSQLLLRTEMADINREHDELTKALFTFSAMDAVPLPVLLLDEHRQIIAANTAFFSHFKGLGLPLKLGFRPGEALNCIHAFDCNSGCGTGDHCLECGALQTILLAQKGISSTHRCNLTLDTICGAKDISARVSASPFTCGEHSYTMIVLQDITGKVLKSQIDREFFHSVLNSASVVLGFAKLLVMQGLDTESGQIQAIIDSTEKIVAEVNAHRDLSYAEAKTLVIHLYDVNAKDVLKSVTKAYKEGSNPTSILLTQPMTQELTVRSDPKLLNRILSNLLLCVVQSSATGAIIELGCELVDSDKARFWFRNRDLQYSPEECAYFRNSLCTAMWCGVGSYTLELIASNYLRGIIDATCDELGTRFSITIPLTLPGELEIDLKAQSRAKLRRKPAV